MSGIRGKKVILHDMCLRDEMHPKRHQITLAQMIAVAEESNSLEKVLVDIANALEKRSARQLKLFVKLLEPFMLLFMAAIVLVVVMGLLLPVFKMGSAVG